MKKLSELSAAQGKAALLLAAGRSKSDTAKEVGVDPSTVFAWLRDPKFEAQVNLERENTLSEARDKFRNLAVKAAETLGELLNDESPTVRLGAAKLVSEQLGLFTGPLGVDAGIGWTDGLTESERKLKLLSGGY